MLSGSKNVSVSIFLVEWEARELKSAKRMSKLAPMQIVSAVLLTWAVSTAQSVAGEAAKANCVSGDYTSGFGRMLPLTNPHSSPRHSSSADQG